MPEVKKSTLADKLAGVSVPKPRTRPLWAGPEDAGPMGGVTFSMLSRYLSCKERARLTFVEGLRPAPRFNHRIEYGQMWHLCEEVLARNVTLINNWCPALDAALAAYCKNLVTKYPLQQEEIFKWYNVCRVQFPEYVEYWRDHPDTIHRTQLLQEQVFRVPVTLPSGRTVYLRGKWDGAALVGKEDRGVYLDEHKTKGDIDELQVYRQLTFDLQTMIYLVALGEEQRRLDDSTVKARLAYKEGKYRHFYPIKGVRYNVVRRPLSGGKGSIVRHKPTKSNPAGETEAEYYERLRSIIRESADTFFMRWQVEVTPGDVARFRRVTLDPLLENLCDDYEWWDRCFKLNADPFDGELRREYYPHHCPRHYVHPFGVRNILDEGGSTDLDAKIVNDDEVGLVRVDTLFEELQT